MKKTILFYGLLVAALFAGLMPAQAHIITARADVDLIMKQRVKHPETAMTERQLNYILNAMRRKKNDAGKKYVLKNGLKSKGITVDQLTRLLNQFLTDDSKLNCALYAYPYTVDYQNYLKIEDLFADHKAKDGLEDFVRKNK